ncbi:MAG: DUF3040 domain-containing protein [Propionibacteriaceae bacterium]|jgi:Flp pilus assembly protein TadB|nr:DUF3040 domain-containing protein [Propionibacteriaceae bacterium]
MPLSEEEQRIFEELQAQLTEEDPKLAKKLKSHSPRKLHGRRAALAGFIFVIGIVALIWGLRTQWYISVIGFVLMLAGAVLGITAWQRVEADIEAEEASQAHFEPPSWL